MKARSILDHENRKASGSGWHRQAVAVGTAALLALSPVAPAWASPAGTVALPAGGAPAKLAAATPAPSPTSGCQLNSPRGKVSRIVTIIFDNTHFKRDPARDGSTLVPSDLEQMPHLLNFIKQNGVLLSNHHTPLIAHTSDDIITILTGVYPARHGVATAANSYLEYSGPNGTTQSQSGFTYWTDLSRDNTYNLISGPVDADHMNGVNAPAPWVPFTRAGCDVGAAAAADMEIENTGVDLATVFGPGSPQTTDPNAFANYEGVAIHCAASSTLCSAANGGFPDKLPSEPNADGTAATTDPATGTSTAYEGYNALFGHKYVTQAFQNLGFKPGGNVLDANGNLNDINGNTIVDDFNNILTPGFPGFSIAPQYSLGYVADMLEAGVPVVYAYINTPHRPMQTNPYGYGVTGDVNDYGPGEAHYVFQLQQYDDAFNKFFKRLAKDGITEENTLFMIMAEEGDHVVAAEPTNAPCDGVNKPCTYGDTVGNEVGELALNFTGLLQAEAGITTPSSVNSDAAPDIYLTNNPGPNDPTLRTFERASGTVSVTNPISGATDTIAQVMANPVEFKMLHMQTFDPLRTPSFTIFANPDYFVTGSSACGTSTTPATSCVTQQPGFAWNHGDVQPEITNTWLGIVGPGIDDEGVDNRTWSDHTDVRPTMLTLLGLKDDYPHDGRALVEKFEGWAQPSAVKKSDNFVALARALKQITAPVGPLGLATLHASTVALESGNAGDDSVYTSIENQLASYTSQRDALVAQILPLLEAAELDGTPIPDGVAHNLIHQAANLLSSVQAYANGL
jgi:arylsulfatase A-like enzyme